ncbi:aminotransferase class V-fold PLP-dependent enzyme [Streptomyces iranensis]|uniref:Aminotransferase class V n=1 Tax=Streptomyces iranensis TaxID=576784 RepID=A0A060ZXG2_9ACTN|nr:aminotransferase class V-fold PLP-dependent enzyme [Streptomyces iranensis]MBP2059090.1 selenocysteine lyase/cysteine desulfurase [Streptomyces iranensis]CDR11856.1 aminotransferase class V [Streptomyces iranensis]
MESLAGAEFAPHTTYLTTASSGLIPARSVAAVKAVLDGSAAGQPIVDVSFEAVEASRAAYARLVGVPARRVAAGSSVAGYAGMIATSLPPGAEVLVADGDFSSLVNPFAVRGDLKLRIVPLEEIAEAVRPGTALVAVSAVQSADGRIADLAAIREAARTHGARTLVDISQAAGWFPVNAAEADYTVCVAYKWLLCPRGAAFLTVPEDLGELTPVFAGWVAGEKPWDSCYGPVEELAHSARRFDESPSVYAYVAARHSLGLIEELGTEAIAAHDRALADRFRDGVVALGHQPVAAPGSAIVSVPGLGGAASRLAEAEVHVSARAGNLRASFHLYNTVADVDRLLERLSG